ncbi:DegV family protein [Mesomycoplasma hyorhinis]|uniref:DegV family EDD domain-containing protein n=5 Tax=Mesomycoplasma hyorhinis TaxID=2100 RepID=A0ABD6IEH1_MESHY|nr:DegV family protein [Mesomycoplasma hyorhinis]ADM21572.1 Fatty acid-binding protein DegV-like protein [Mesomycoplasma hyorhinis HUB-1]AEC45881.1 Fatty acid-binding protein DegV-like protein [Mesomycoplasma hyorhinis MCLD]AEX13904.1 DegV family protein [Mesomycoplasma hyorhinis GDL-1]AFX74044.1 hypothetical protein MOS_112 [Mesomycoplasma hyorhinis SK76]AHA40866.1 DegV family protein [Mesomycoplasma hyorhinis DBS 1050]MBY7704995.1 DegV family protein [Vibrio harveyi]CRH25441.1 DegV domain-
MKIAIVVDSSTGLNPQLAHKLDVFFLPLTIYINDKEYQDGIDLQEGEIFELISKKSKVKTSTTLLGQVQETIEKLSKEYDKVILYPISQYLSSQYQNFVNLAKDFENVKVVSSTKLTLLIILDILRFRDQIVSGVDFDTAFEILNQEVEGKFLLFPHDNSYLVNSGRLSSSAAVLTKLLKIVPVIKFEGGKLHKEGKGNIFHKTILKFFKQTVDKFGSGHQIVLLHSYNENIEKIRTEMETYSQQTIHTFNIPDVISVHTGPQAIAFAVLKVEDKYVKQIVEIFN